MNVALNKFDGSDFDKVAGFIKIYCCPIKIGFD